jgi:hypothetical protein
VKVKKGFRIFFGASGAGASSHHPECNAYKEGLGAKWASIAQYWADPKAHPEVFDTFVSLAATKQRHTPGPTIRNAQSVVR